MYAYWLLDIFFVLLIINLEDNTITEIIKKLKTDTNEVCYFQYRIIRSFTGN